MGDSAVGLLDRLREGDQAACRSVYRQYAKSLFQYALFLLGDRYQAEDIVQENFMRFFQQCKKGIVIQNMKTYLFTSLRNGVFNAIRDRRQLENKRERFVDDTQSEHVSHKSAVNISEETEAFYARLATLPKEQREVMALKVMSGYTFEEVAELTDTATSTTYKRYQLAIQKLKDTWLQDSTGDSNG